MTLQSQLVFFSVEFQALDLMGLPTWDLGAVFEKCFSRKSKFGNCNNWFKLLYKQCFGFSFQNIKPFSLVGVFLCVWFVLFFKRFP